jgi:hypothetical protein
MRRAGRACALCVAVAPWRGNADAARGAREPPAGNFCSTMFNELCRVGTLLTLQLTPAAADGDAAAAGTPWDWRLPTWHWLYNEARVLLRAPRAPPRRLLYAARDGADDCGLRGADGADGAELEANALSARKRALLAFVRAHVLHPGGAGARSDARRPPPFGF